MKPELFLHERLADLPVLARYAFIGLFTQADRAGRLEDRPRRLKMQILPYDDVDMDQVLQGLADAGFVERYTADGTRYLAIPSFLDHQRPRDDEGQSLIPPRFADTEPPPLLASDDGDTHQREGKGKEKGKGVPIPAESGPFGAEAVVELWNATVTPPIPKIEKLTPDRRAKIRARLQQFPERAAWVQVVAWVNTQEWCRAPGTGNHPNWTASIDWLAKNDSTFARTLERARADAVRRNPADRRRGSCPHVPSCPESLSARDCDHRTTFGEARWRELYPELARQIAS